MLTFMGRKEASVSVQLDNIDSEIIELLQKDGRMMYKEIAESVGVSLPTVRTRMKKLTEMGVIKKFTAILDSEKFLGRTRIFVTAKLAEGDVTALKDQLSKLGEVRSAYFIAGEKQVMIELEIDDLQNLSELLSKKLPSQTGLSDFSSFVVSKVLKEEYGASVKPNAPLQFRCDFCGTLIPGKPIVELISGGRYYFSGEECLQAYKERIASHKSKE
ncbi:MAG: winged helix-turn-helix transcriptional regulator [Thaumarchaeota archaeon]|nr:winged helix-turn-helix transcriptional regulator [Nitrososphaerota archaeon]